MGTLSRRLPIGKSFKPRKSEALRDVNAAIKLDPALAAVYRQKGNTIQHQHPSAALELQNKAIALRQEDYLSPYLLWERTRLLRKLARRNEVMAESLSAAYSSPRLGSPFAHLQLWRLAKIGYYISPDEQFSNGNQAIQDAVTACSMMRSAGDVRAQKYLCGWHGLPSCHRFGLEPGVWCKERSGSPTAYVGVEDLKKSAGSTSRLVLGKRMPTWHHHRKQKKQPTPPAPSCFLPAIRKRRLSAPNSIYPGSRISQPIFILPPVRK